LTAVAKLLHRAGRAYSGSATDPCLLMTERLLKVLFYLQCL